MQRFFIDNGDLKTGIVCELPMNICHQVLNVLRMKNGAQVLLLDGQGGEYAAELQIDGKKVSGKILGVERNPFEAEVEVILFQSLLKSQEKFEWSAQKATELGATAITPLICDRCQVQALKKKERIEKIIREAAEQCERGKLPNLNDEISFDDMIESLNSLNSSSPEVTTLFCYEGIRQKMSPLPSLGKKINVIIGPEGGFSPKEIEKMEEFCQKNSNFHMIGLGRRILRSETAAITALSQILPYF
ncbi:16S rRNA (uracil(1498)-N(3))-methyltransferase [Candidatus Peregrinibacteria bacterium]|jgi:16S rRNA (uracil1498-N3)-methyltransferase|nr:16S rRNA (uracil(1498)-N(3))-methyltransferase [Candidatus Peregrinibacteria bacterium]